MTDNSPAAVLAAARHLAEAHDGVLCDLNIWRIPTPNGPLRLTFGPLDGDTSRIGVDRSRAAAAPAAPAWVEEHVAPVASRVVLHDPDGAPMLFEVPSEVALDAVSAWLDAEVAWQHEAVRVADEDVEADVDVR